MAKYVGKIFVLPNNALNIKRTGAHCIHVQWYNSRTHKFRCRTITSLEERKEIPATEREDFLKDNLYHKEDDGTFSIFKKHKYRKIRDGRIEPIPMQILEGFSAWSGYEGTQFLTKSQLKNAKEQKNMRILTKKIKPE